MKTTNGKIIVVFSFTLAVLCFVYQPYMLADGEKRNQIVLYYEKSGGINGASYKLTIFKDNYYIFSGGEQRKLPADIQERLRFLVENYGYIKSKGQSPPGVRDGGRSHLEFWGRGVKHHDKQGVSDVLELARAVYKMHLGRPYAFQEDTIRRPYDFRRSYDYMRLSYLKKRNWNKCTTT